MRSSPSPPPAAIFIILLTCFSSRSNSQSLAQAASGDTIISEDHNHHRLLDFLDRPNAFPDEAVQITNYEAEFTGLDKGIVGRAPEAITTLSNNAPKSTDIDQGDIQYWTFPKATIQGPYGQSALNLPLNLTTTNTTCLERDLIQLAQTHTTTGGSRNVSLTISTCDQPTSSTADGTSAPLQLEVYVSHSSSNQRPDNGQNDQVITVDGGYGFLNLTGISNDIWIGVRAPKSSNFEGIYNYELAASIDAPYATYFEGNPTPWDTEIKTWDTDTNSSLLGTGDITNDMSNSTNFAAWMDNPPPFSIYVNNRDNPAIQGLQKSVCGLKNRAQIQRSNNTMVKIGGQPRQLFYVTGLNASSSYDAIMTLERGPSSNSTIGGGGTVWRATNFTTKTDNNCQVVYSLPFCTDVAYAVPSNLSFVNNMTALALTYDKYANDSYQNFSKSLQQIPCNTTPSAQYSLARNCDDCDNAYKTWLCAVTIPRCADFSSPPGLTYLLPRNINTPTFINGTKVPDEPKGSIFSKENKTTSQYAVSRNPMIDDQIKPGPYKEVLPCKDLCYHLMQNCPAALQFACPTEKRGMNFSYGHYSTGDTEWYCNWPGGKLVNGVRARGVGWVTLGLVLAVAMFVF